LFGADASLTLLHVGTPPSRFPFAQKKSGQREALDAEFELAMRPARRLLKRATVAWREERAQGEPGVEIAAYARRHACDLIVMGSHGRGAMTGLLLGSVTQKTLSGCRTPVLIVR
jgi:nucleotide-binding universal stress UspA family protein